MLGTSSQFISTTHFENVQNITNRDVIIKSSSSEKRRPRSDSVPGQRHQSERSLLLVPEHKFRHRARARVLS